MTHRDASQDAATTGSIDVTIADGSTDAALDADIVVDGVAAELFPLIVTRVVVETSNVTQVFDAGTDPSATTDRLHDDSPMLPERPDHSDHHS